VIFIESLLDLLQPWKAHVMLEKPWAFPIFLISSGILLSTITWVSGRSTKSNKV